MLPCFLKAALRLSVPVCYQMCIRDRTDDTVCAVMLEFIQGEGGVLPLEEGFVKELAGFCKAKKLLLIADEVQTGVGLSLIHI